MLPCEHNYSPLNNSLGSTMGQVTYNQFGRVKTRKHKLSTGIETTARNGVLCL